MKTEAEIYLEYETAIAQAESLTAAAENIRKSLSEGINELSGIMSASWKGQSAEAFASKCSAFQEKAGRISQALMESAEVIRTIADNIYQAEMNALMLAAAREY
ncbi:MAG: WXG100 family type VII secretion target [Blautia sp.]|nr:WXG100 family type VII secretion target [Blautia sp.]